MAKAEEVGSIQLASRIPKNLHRRLKLYCVTHDMLLMQFVVEAIETTLGQKRAPQKGGPESDSPSVRPLASWETVEFKIEAVCRAPE